MDCRHALPSEISDFEDALMVETAILTEADCIVTRNIRDYSKSPVQVYTPKEFLRELENLTEDEKWQKTICFLPLLRFRISSLPFWQERPC